MIAIEHTIKDVDPENSFWWVMYASAPSGQGRKRLEILAGQPRYRTKVGGMVRYDGPDPEEAVEAYNKGGSSDE